jgi:hypothetical protein
MANATPLGKAAYSEYIRSNKWRAVRARYLKSDLPKHCHVCKTKYREDFHFHHLTYSRLGMEDLQDIVPVCAECHEIIHAVHDQNVGDLRAATAYTCRMFEGKAGFNGEQHLRYQEVLHERAATYERMTTARDIAIVKDWYEQRKAKQARLEEAKHRERALLQKAIDSRVSHIIYLPKIVRTRVRGQLNDKVFREALQKVTPDLMQHIRSEHASCKSTDKIAWISRKYELPKPIILDIVHDEGYYPYGDALLPAEAYAAANTPKNVKQRRRSKEDKIHTKLRKKYARKYG